MHLYYRILDLPKDPLKDKSFILEKYSNNIKGYNVEDTSIIKDEVLEIFLKIGLRPDFVVIFTPKTDGEEEKRLLHSDITYVKDSKTWEDITFSVNWDVEGVGIFKWAEVPAEIKKFYPLWPPFNPVFRKLSGTHFGDRYSKGIPAGSKILDSVSTSNVMLVRTDIPHIITHNVPRVCVSLRFKDSINRNWTEIYQQFDSISL